MITLRPAAERGHVRMDWLDARHSFSFGSYHDPAHIAFSNLRVLNEDTIAPGGGFPTHGHEDMEIVTYVLSGALEHRDSLGNGSVIRPGDVQYMSAGSGVRHSEVNPSRDEAVHLLQIWLLPNRPGVTPRYAQKHFGAHDKRGVLRLLVSPDGREESIASHQDGLIYGTVLAPGQTVTHVPADGRRTYVHVARGAVTLNGQPLAAGDGARIEQERALVIAGLEDAEILLFDLP